MLRGILSNWFGDLILGLISFLLTPFMVHRLGDLDYGVYVLTFSVVFYSGLLELGIRGTLQRFTGLHRGAGDRRAQSATLSTALVLTGLVGSLIIFLSLTLSPFLPVFFHVTGREGSRFRWLIVLLGLNLGFGLPAFLLSAYLNGLERFDFANAVQVARQVLRALLIVVVLLLGYGVLAVGTAILASQLASIPLGWWLIRKADPEVRLSWHLVSRRLARQLLTFSFWTMLNNAGQLLRDSTDSIVIGRVLGAALITPYNVAARLIGYFRPIIITMSGPLLPRVSKLEGSGRLDLVAGLYFRMTRLTAIVTLFGSSLLLLDGRLILRLWVGGQYVSSYSVLVWLTVGALVSLAQYSTLQLLTGLGRHRPYGLWTFAEGLLNLVLSVVWARRYGIVGVAMGTAVPLLLVKLTLQPWYTMRVLRQPLRKYFEKALARPVLASSLFLVLAWRWGGIPSQGTLVSFLWRAAWQSALFGLLVVLVGIHESDRRLAFEAVRRAARFSQGLARSAMLRLEGGLPRA